MKVLVLGCGPAGLMAAHAATILQHDVIIVSKPRKSHMKGAQYLHQPIPMASTTAFVVRYQLVGSNDEYKYKVYGDARVDSVSPEDLTGSHMGWDIREAYDWLWGTYGDYVQPREFWHAEDVQSTIDWANADKVISTIPANVLCRERHSFPYQTILSTDQALLEVPNNFILCNGRETPAWYRVSNIDGWGNTEWPIHTRPPIPQDRLWDVKKPIRNNCNCFPEVVRMGRYGRWEKGVLSHSAFYETLDLLSPPLELL